MRAVFGHIGGIAIEETALSLAPLMLPIASLGIVLVKERARRRAYKHHDLAEPPISGDAAPGIANRRSARG